MSWILRGTNTVAANGSSMTLAVSKYGHVSLLTKYKLSPRMWAP